MRPPETLGQAVFRILPQRDLLRLLPVLQEHQVIQQQEAVMRALQLFNQSPTRYEYLSRTYLYKQEYGYKKFRDLVLIQLEKKQAVRAERKYMVICQFKYNILLIDGL